MKPKALTPSIVALAALTCAPLASASLITYIPGASVLQTWDFTGSQNPGWNLERTTTLTAGGIQLGTADIQEGMMSIAAPEGLSYVDSGVEMTFVGTLPDYYHQYLTMMTWEGTQGDNPREGFSIAAAGSEMRTQQLHHTQSEETWGNQDMTGAHTLALLRRANGAVETYMDSTLVNSRTSDAPTTALGVIAVGQNVWSGDWYIPAGTVVSEVTAFNLTAIPEPGSLLALGGLLGTGLLLRSRRR